MAATYTYDALGRRIGTDDSGTKTWTVYNGTSADANPDADFTSSGALKMRYVDGLVVDEILAQTDAGSETGTRTVLCGNTTRDPVPVPKTARTSPVLALFVTLVALCSKALVFVDGRCEAQAVQVVQHLAATKKKIPDRSIANDKRIG
jgi:hypothetical protein